MSDKPYVDPNSGAAPQPGGYAGVEAAEKGFAIPADAELESEQSPAEYEAPGGNPSAGAVTVPQVEGSDDSEGSEENDSEETEDESGSAETGETGEPGAEGEADDDASVEHQAVDPRDPDVGAYDPSKYGVEEVNAYLAENPDQKDAVLAAEKKGKNRKSITGE